MVLAFDFLDSMAWDVALSAVLLAAGALTLRYNSKEGRVEGASEATRMGFAVASGAAGLYLFVSGLAINFMWPLSLNGGIYNVLFGGISALGGLVMLAGAAALGRNLDIRPVTYFAAVVGVYAIIDAGAIFSYGLTKEPLLSALGYLSFAAPAVLSVPLARLDNSKCRFLFAALSTGFAAAWTYQAASFTLAHLKP
jgi:uncharacterized membrane protein